MACGCRKNQARTVYNSNSSKKAVKLRSNTTIKSKMKPRANIIPIKSQSQSSPIGKIELRDPEASIICPTCKKTLKKVSRRINNRQIIVLACVDRRCNYARRL